MTITREDDVIFQQLAFGNARIMTTKEFQRIMLGTNGWFTWSGEIRDIIGKSVGGGLMSVTSSVRKYTNV